MFEMNKKTLRNLFLVVAAGIILYWLLHDSERVGTVFGVIKGIFSPFVLGAGLAFVLNVPMRVFEKLFKKVKRDKFRRLIAVVLTLLAVLLVLTLVSVLLIPQLVATVYTLINRLNEFNLESFIGDMMVQFPRVTQWVIDNTNLENFDFFSLSQQGLSVFGSSISTVLGGTFSAISTVFGGIVDFVIAFVFALYCLFQKEVLARQGRKLLYAFLPEKAADYIVHILRLSNSTFSNFLSGQCVEVCILGFLFAICMTATGMPYTPLISILIAVTAFIPIVGAFVGCIIGAFLIFVNDPGSWQAVIFVGMFLVIQQIENNLIYPRVVGNSIGLNGMWVLVAVASGGELFGVAGMFLMIPVVSVIYTLLREITNKRLAGMDIDPEKLKDQPPELMSHFKEKQKINKARRLKRRFERKSQKSENE